ncbi:MAG: phosphatidate cytidylyltransferase [Armatimonadetes bacterium]|nr:phosphatidate cytidylyltransferase [Candidatus Hippobium faecium]
MKRVLSGVLFFVFAILIIFCPNHIPLTCVVGILAVLGLCELFKNVRSMEIYPVWWLGIAATVLFVIASAFKSTIELAKPIMDTEIEKLNTLIQINGFNYVIPTGPENYDIMPLFPAIITGLVFLGFLWEFFRKDRSPVKNIGATLFGAIYIGWLISHLVSLRCLDGSVSLFGKNIALGSALVMFCIICTSATDTFAFFIGKKFGKHKIAPKSSPNKTWEGSVGGWLGCVIFGTLWGYVSGLPLVHTIIMSIVCGVISQLGDLTESSIKREIGIKDFSNLIPGHGGILDRIDSLLFTAPFVYYYIIIFAPNLFR